MGELGEEETGMEGEEDDTTKLVGKGGEGGLSGKGMGDGGERGRIMGERAWKGRRFHSLNHLDQGQNCHVVIFQC